MALEYACGAADDVSDKEECEIAQAGLRRGRIKVWEEESRKVALKKEVVDWKVHLRCLTSGSCGRRL